jgi:hypothetical protein
MNYPIMYYALDVRRVIPRRIPRVWSQITRKAIVAQRRRGEIFSKLVFATNKNPDWRSRARAYLQESIQESRGGGGSRKVGGRSIYLHTPRKIHAPFPRYKHTSLVFLDLVPMGE